MSNCKAYRDHTGGYVCDRCGTYWDADDEKPPCRPPSDHKASPQTRRAELDRIKENLRRANHVKK